jgi:predicted DNA-binding ribbon-helix-helix protein
VSAVVKRSVTIRGHRTSVSLEQTFIDEIERIAAARDMPVARLVAEIDVARPEGSNLSSALRLYVLDWYRRGQAAPDS